MLHANGHREGDTSSTKQADRTIDALPADRGNAICTWWSLVKGPRRRKL